MAQMPEEGRKFSIVDMYWRDIMTQSVKDTHCLVVTSQNNMLPRLCEANVLLEDIQKGLNDYLEKKRLYFPRSASSCRYFVCDSSGVCTVSTLEQMLQNNFRREMFCQRHKGEVSIVLHERN